MHFIRIIFLLVFFVALNKALWAEELTVTIYSLNESKKTKGVGEMIGEIILKDTQYGLLFTPTLKHLSPGIHGFHIHVHPSCEGDMKQNAFIPGANAGDHYDPHNTQTHQGPYANAGHLGDLPPLFCDQNHTCTTPVLAPKLKVRDVFEHSLIIHAGGDNFADQPKPLGGGGPRVACGIVK